MSTVAPPRPTDSTRPTDPTRSSWRGPVRVVVRQHRWVLLIAGTLTLIGVAALIGYTLWASHVTADFKAGPCPTTSGDPGRSCYQPVREYLDVMVQFSTRIENAALILTALPALLSAFVAGPMIARELESGTYKLAWSQSVSPTRWLAAKLAVPTALMIAAVCVMSGVVAWARTHLAAEYPAHWFERLVFGSTGTVPAGYTLLGIAVGALIGMLVRRTVAAMSLAALVTGAAIVTLGILRSGLWSLRTASGPVVETFRIPDDSWIVEDGRLTGSGAKLPRDLCWQTGDNNAKCLAEHDVTGWFYDYHPASHFWPLQLVETGILLVLAALATALAFRVLRSRHG